MTKIREDRLRGPVVKVAVEVSVDLDRRMRMFALERGMTLWRAWELAAVDLVERGEMVGLERDMVAVGKFSHERSLM